MKATIAKLRYPALTDPALTAHAPTQPGRRRFLGCSSALLLAACGGGGDGGGGGGSGGGAATGRFSQTGPMATARWSPDAVRLNDGRVLVVGGSPNSGSGVIASAEIYNPSTGTWSAAASPAAGARGNFLILLPGGNVLALLLNGATNIAQIFNAATGQWTTVATPPLRYSGDTSSMVLLADGRVLAVPSGQSTLMVYNPGTNTWATTGSYDGRFEASATLLANGRVLIAGGWVTATSNVLLTCLIHDPATGQTTATGSMIRGRRNHASALLPNGRVVVSHGIVTDTLTVDGTTEIYNPANGTWAVAGNIIKFNASTLGAGYANLGNGRLFVTGGATGSGGNIVDNPPQGQHNETNAEVFDPASGSWSRVTPPGTGLNDPRRDHATVVLADGGVLVAGGFNGQALRLAEVWRP